MFYHHSKHTFNPSKSHANCCHTKCPVYWIICAIKNQINLIEFVFAHFIQRHSFNIELWTNRFLANVWIFFQHRIFTVNSMFYVERENEKHTKKERKRERWSERERARRIEKMNGSKWKWIREDVKWIASEFVSDHFSFLKNRKCNLMKANNRKLSMALYSYVVDSVRLLLHRICHTDP